MDEIWCIWEDNTDKYNTKNRYKTHFMLFWNKKKQPKGADEQTQNFYTEVIYHLFK